MSETRIVFGFHAVNGALRRRADGVLDVYLDAGRRDARALDLAAKARSLGIRVIEADAARIAAIAGTAKHQGVAARVHALTAGLTIEALLGQLEQPALLLVLDGVQDPHNLGACLRVADAFDAQAVIAPKDRAVSMTPTVAKVASGAAETVPYIQVTNLARSLQTIKDAGIWVMGADQEAAEPVSTARLDGPIAWVLGAEAGGLRRLTRATCDQVLRIPIGGTVGSLNVSVAAGICLYECRRQRLVVNGSAAKGA